MPAQKRCVQKKGCCTALVWGIILGVLGIGFILIAVLLPPYVQTQIDSGICDVVCVPTINDPYYVYQNWLSNDNATQYPPEYFSFWLWNITNTFDIETYGATPVLTRVGPYVYLIHREKFNVDYEPAQPPTYVTYETQETYDFLPNMSAGSEDDMIYSVNLPFLGGVQQSWAADTKHGPMQPLFSSLCEAYNYTSGQDDQTCLWSYRTAYQTLWSQYSYFSEFSNMVYFSAVPGGFFPTTFQLFVNDTSPEDAHVQKTYQANYGLGGKCDLIQSGIGSFCQYPAMTPGTDIRHVQYTGRDSFDNMAKYIKFFGNTTIQWNGTEDVRGTDHFQFSPGVEKDDTLTIFDDLLLRHVDLQFIDEETILGIDVYRFGITSDLYESTDPVYFQAPPGFVDGRTPSLVSHGIAAPSYISRPYLAGVNDSIRLAWDCTNCPDLTDNLQDYEPYLIVEPTTGKVLGGNKRAQFNVRIGQDYLFGNATMVDEQYHLVPDVYIPIFTFEDSSMFVQAQADQVSDGLDAISMGRTIQEASLIGGSVLAGLSIIASLVLLNHWRVLKQEEGDDWGAAADDYSTLPSQRGNDSTGNFGQNVQHVQHTPY